VVQGTFGRRATLLRPQVVAGPGDLSGRVAHWHAQSQGLFPGDGNDWLQMVDVRDVADFIVTVITHDLGGAFNLSGPRLRWSAFASALGVCQPRWAALQGGSPVDPAPLFRPAGTPLASLMDVSHAHALAHGFRPRPAVDTVRDFCAALPAPPAVGVRG
jgi:2'-hydroxyisoflavone reductase